MSDRPVLVADITGRAARESLRIVAPSDFRTGEWRPAEALSAVRHFVPYCLDVRAKRSLYVRAGGARSIQRAKLQYVHLRERATSLASIPWENGRISQGPVPPAAFLFSIGRCGSTLFVDAMSRGGALGLSEPDFFTQATAAHLQGGRSAPVRRELSIVLRALTADLLSALAEPNRRSGLVKLRAQCCKAPDLIVPAPTAGATTFFMIREFEPWARSVLRASALSPAAVVERYLEGLQCLRWLRPHTECHLVRYEELIAEPERVLHEAAAAIGCSLNLAGVKAAMRQDAQTGTALARRRLAGRELEPGALARAVDLWMAKKSDALLEEVGLPGYC